MEGDGCPGLVVGETVDNGRMVLGNEPFLGIPELGIPDTGR